MHDFPLIATIAAGFTAAWVFGLITQRVGLSPIVGYLLAGVLIGPHTPGFRGDIGETLFTSPPLAGLRHFQTLIAADDRLFVGADGRLYAFGLGQ